MSCTSVRCADNRQFVFVPNARALTLILAGTAFFFLPPIDFPRSKSKDLSYYYQYKVVAHTSHTVQLDFWSSSCGSKQTKSNNNYFPFITASMKNRCAEFGRAFTLNLASVFLFSLFSLYFFSPSCLFINGKRSRGRLAF